MNSDYPTAESSDMASYVAKLFGFGGPRQTHAATPSPRVLVTLPTSMDIEQPTTREARAALAMAAHALAAIVERRTGSPTTARACYEDAQRVLHSYLVTYRRGAERRG